MNISLASIAKFHKQQPQTRAESFDRYFIMTVDVDGWSSLLHFYSVNHNPSEADSQVNVEKGILILLRLFEEHGIKATFFVTGEMAQKHAWAVKKTFQNGHEIACHGLAHQKNECLLSRTTQEQKIGEATRIIEERIQVRPEGFRAPCLRVNENTLAVLEENGYVYDSSVIPTFIPGYYGSPGSTFKPYHPSSQSLKKKGSSKLLELPVSVNPVLPLPLNAAWMRNFGTLWVKLGVKTNFFLNNPVVFYVHPRDVLPLPKVEGVPWHLYRNVGDSAVRMLDEIIEYAKKLGARFLKAIDLAQITL